MSSGGTSSRLHSHDDHNLHCVLFGRRDFILMEGQFKQNFKYQLDVSKIDYFFFCIQISTVTLSKSEARSSNLFKAD